MAEQPDQGELARARVPARGRAAEGAPGHEGDGASAHGRLDRELRRLDVHLELLRGDIEQGVSGEALHRVDLLTAAVGRLRKLAAGLEWLTELEARQEAPRLVPIDEPLDEALVALAGPLDRAEALVVRDALPEAWVRPGDLRVVFEELLANALRFRGAEPPVVRITAEGDGDRWVVIVEDDGTGFDPEQAPDLFEPGVALAGGSGELGGGVGLAACRLLLRRNGGEIGASARPGEGARFAVRVPCGGTPGTGARE